MKWIVYITVLLTLGPFCHAQQTVLVAAAANLSALEGPLTTAFEEQFPGVRVQFTFGSSGTLVTQISEGAPFDVFLSADLAFARKLVDLGAASGPVKTYAIGKLIFLSTRPLDCTRGLNALLDPSVGQFANSDPVTAPYGRAAVEALTRAGIYDRVKAKEVTASSVAQALQFTLTATGCGFVGMSALRSREVKPFDQKGVYWFEVDPKMYSPLAQGFVVTNVGIGKPGALDFGRFLLSPRGQTLFIDYGYGRP